MRAASLPGMRLREVEIHHVDLGAGYTTADWSPAFAVLLLDAMTKRLEPPERVRGAAARRRPHLDLRPDGDDGPRSSPAPAADLGWWLTGRPAPETLSCSRGELPEIEGW